MDDKDFDRVLSSVFNEEISAPQRLVADTKRKMKRGMELHYFLGFSLVLNMLIFIGVILCIVFAPNDIVVKLTIYTVISAITNIIILFIVLFKDNVNHLLDAL